MQIDRLEDLLERVKTGSLAIVRFITEHNYEDGTSTTTKEVQ